MLCSHHWLIVYMLPKIDHLLSKYTFVRLWLGIILFLLIWRIPYYGMVVLDDPFITFRYATNFIEHGQFVFNLGQNVLATTTPTYATLMTFVAALNLPLPLMSTLINLIFEMILLWFVGDFLQLLTPKKWRTAWLLAAILIISNRAISIASNSGMETALFILLNLATISAITKQKYTLATILGSLTTLTRPDGIFVLLILGIMYMVDKRRVPIWHILGSILIALPWILVAYQTYGSPIPNSVTAKAAIEHLWFTSLQTKLYVIFAEPLRIWGLVTIPIMLIAALKFWKLRKFWPLLLFVIMHLLYAILPSNLGFDWYFAPLFVAFAILTGLGLVELLSSEQHKVWAYLAALLLAVGLVHSTLGNYLSVREIDRIWHDGMFEVLDYLDEEAADDATVQCTNIGILAFYSDYQILDPLGLASPQVIPLFEDVSDLPTLRQQVAENFQPDYIVSFGYTDYEGYAVRAEFPTETMTLVVYGAYND